MVISCTIFNRSIKFKFIHKISVIHKKFPVFFNLLRGPDKTRSGAGSGPRAAGCASLLYNIYNMYVAGNKIITLVTAPLYDIDFLELCVSGKWKRAEVVIPR